MKRQDQLSGLGADRVHEKPEPASDHGNVKVLK